MAAKRRETSAVPARRTDTEAGQRRGMEKIRNPKLEIRNKSEWPAKAEEMEKTSVTCPLQDRNTESEIRNPKLEIRNKSEWPAKAEGMRKLGNGNRNLRNHRCAAKRRKAENKDKIRTGNTKSEIRSSKSETNPNGQQRRRKWKKLRQVPASGRNRKFGWRAKTGLIRFSEKLRRKCSSTLVLLR